MAGVASSTVSFVLNGKARKMRISEAVEQRVDQKRREEYAGDGKGQGSDPCPQPPAARAVPQQPIEAGDHQRADEQRDQLGFGPVPQPRGPALHGEAEAP